MGTSGSYSAPPSWGDLKSNVTRVAMQGAPTNRRIADIIQSFVQHIGGARAVARESGGGGGGVATSGQAGKRSARNLAGFISDVRRLGLEGALREAGWTDLIGRPVQEVFNALLDRLSGEASLLDDGDARIALYDLYDEYFAEADTPEQLEEIMLTQVDQLGLVLKDFFGFYLYQHFCRVFFERLVQRVGETKAESLLDAIRHFIKSKLTNLAIDSDLSKVDWSGPDGNDVITEIMETTLEVFEG